MLGYAPRGSQPLASTLTNITGGIVTRVRALAARCMSGMAFVSQRLSGLRIHSQRLGGWR